MVKYYKLNTPGSHRIGQEGLWDASRARKWERGALTGAGDEDGCLRLEMGETPIAAAPVQVSQIGVRWLLQECRERNGNRERRKGATGAPVPPRSSTGNNGGEVKWVFGARTRPVGASAS